MNKLLIIGLLVGGLVLGVAAYFVLFAVAPAVIPAVVLVPSGNDAVIVPPEAVAVVVPIVNLTPEVLKVVFIGITTVSPLDLAESQGTSNNIIVTFTEKMNPSTVNEETFIIKGPNDISLKGVITSDTTNKVWTFNPTNTLTSNTKYDITITNKVKGISGNSLDENFIWSFTTGSPSGSGSSSGGHSNYLVLTSVSMSPETVNLTIGSTTQLTAEGLDQYGEHMNRIMLYTTSDANIATVDVNGLVTGVSDGNVTITATNETFSDTSIITVVAPVLTTITLLPTSTNLIVGLTTQLTAEGFDQFGYSIDTNFDYNSSNVNIATVDVNGLVTGVSDGNVSVTALSDTNSDINATSTIAVVDPTLTTITLSPISTNISVGATRQLTAEGFDQFGNSMDANFDYNSSNVNIATVSVNGLVTGVSAGDVIITAAGDTNSDVNATSEVTISTELLANPTAPDLGETDRFVIIASQKVTTTGVTAISDGDIVIEDQARSYYEGFTAGALPGEFIELTNGLSYAHDDTDPALIPAPYASTIAFIDQVRTDLGIAYDFLANDPNPGAPTQVCPIELGGLTLTRGVYKTSSNVVIQQGDLHLDAQGDPDSVWIFTIDGTLTTGAPGGNIVLENGALAKNVYWRIAGITSIGTDTIFKGNVFAWEQVNVLNGADVLGRLFSVNEQVTLIGDTVTKAN